MSWRLPMTRGLLLLMETLWIYALLATFIAVGTDKTPFTPFGVGAAVFLPYLIARVLQQSELELGIVRIWGVLLSLLLFYAIVRVEVFGDLRFWQFGWTDELVADFGKATDGQGVAVVATVLLGVVWMRGLRRGQDSLSFESIVKTFAIGVAVMAAILLLARAVDAPSAIGISAVPFIAIGLLAIGLTHAARDEPDSDRPFGSTWLLAIGGAIVLLSAIALIFVLLDLSTLAEALGVAAAAVGQVIFWMLWPIGWAAGQVITAFIDVLRWAFGSNEPFTPETPPPLSEDAGDETTINLPGWVGDIFRGSAVVGVFLLILTAVALAFRRRRGLRRREPSESTLEEGRLAGELGGLVDSLLGRLRPSFGLGGKLDPVRRLYADLLEAGEKRGVRRELNQTPSELLARLEGVFDSETPAKITATFNDLRYGGIEPAPVYVEKLRAEWEIIRRPPG